LSSTAYLDTAELEERLQALQLWPDRLRLALLPP
jgi:hypothetical protein